MKRKPFTNFASNPWLVFAIFTAAYFLSQFFRATNAVIAPSLRQEMLLSAADLGLMTSLFFATFAVTQFPLGVALDRWGARRVTAGLMIIAVAGSLLFAFGSSFVTLTLGRALLGIGLAGNLMGGIKACSQWFPKERFASVTGLLTGIGALGGLLATTPMAWLNDQFGWRAIFMVGALLVMLSAISILVGTRDRPPAAAATTTKGGENYLLTILRSTSFWRIATPAAWLGGFTTAFRGLWAGPYLFDVYNLSEIETGNLLLILGVGGIAGSILMGWLTDRIGATHVVMIGSVVLIVCQSVLAIQPPLWLVTAVFVIMGLASSFPIALLAQARQLFPAHITGQAFTMVNMTFFVGTFLLQWWIGEILAFFPAPTLGHSLPQGYRLVLGVVATVSGLILLTYLPLTKAQPKESLTPNV